MAASTALDMLSLMQGMIAGSALTESAKQVPNVEVPNVVTQVSAAYCGYTSYTSGNSFLDCMRDIWIPTGTILGTSAGIGVAHVKAGEKLSSWRLIRTGLRFLGFSGKGFVVALA